MLQGMPSCGSPVFCLPGHSAHVRERISVSWSRYGGSTRGKRKAEEAEGEEMLKVSGRGELLPGQLELPLHRTVEHLIVHTHPDSVRTEANAAYYGRSVTPTQILSGRVKPPRGAQKLLRILDKY